MPLVRFFWTQMYRIRTGSITSTRPAYMGPYSAADCCACIRFSRPAGSVHYSLSVTRVLMMMYSFQKDRKLNRITLMMEGFAMGKMTCSMVRA